MAIAITHHIRNSAFRFVDKMKESNAAEYQNLLDDIDSNVAAIEEGKRSALTVLHDLEKLGIDFDATPKIGSEAPKTVQDTNTIYDWYLEADGTQGRWAYDVVDRMKPNLLALKKAFQEFDKSKSDNKDELAKMIPGKTEEEYFRSFQHGTDAVTRERKKYEQRYNNARMMVVKALQVEQIVKRLNDLSSVSCRIERDEDGGYDKSPSPVIFDNAPAHLADKQGTPFKRVIWSIGTLLLLERQEKNEKGEAIPNFTRLDGAIHQGGTYETILKCVERDSDGKNKSKGADIRALKAESPEDVLAIAQVLTAYGYTVTDKSTDNWAIKDKAETRLLAALSAPNKEEDREVIFKLFEMLDSVTSKLDKQRSADVQAKADRAANKATAA